MFGNLYLNFTHDYDLFAHIGEMGETPLNVNITWVGSGWNQWRADAYPNVPP